MTRLEEKDMETVSYYLSKLVEQMKIANKLKALELKGRLDLRDVSPDMVDNIMED